MKKIINGKKYDTETATEIYNRWSNPSTFQEVNESLYRKKTGEFFLAGEGGPDSHYARYEGNSQYGGKNIIPIEINDAKNWIERHANDLYEEVFGEAKE